MAVRRHGSIYKRPKKIPWRFQTTTVARQKTEAAAGFCELALLGRLAPGIPILGPCCLLRRNKHLFFRVSSARWFRSKAIALKVRPVLRPFLKTGASALEHPKTGPRSSSFLEVIAARSQFEE
eukprot:scaffold1678_cov80-Cylindrotheca_fusiformis.AAC.9